jgi:sporulation protein YlmC with PRC-barrel domain
MQLRLGTPVHCSDGGARELNDVIVDPSQRRVTHLVVQPPDRPDLGRLVPVARARGGDRDDPAIQLDCTGSEVDQFEPVHRAMYKRIGEQPDDDPDWGVGIEDVSSLPVDGGFAPGGIAAGVGPIDYDPHVITSYDVVPKGEVEVRRRSAVTSAQGDHLGHVDAFVIDDDRRITNLVLQHGHLWGKREIQVPIEAVQRIDNDKVVLTLSKDELGR